MSPLGSYRRSASKSFLFCVVVFFGFNSARSLSWRVRSGASSSFTGFATFFECLFFVVFFGSTTGASSTVSTAGAGAGAGSPPTGVSASNSVSAFFFFPVFFFGFSFVASAAAASSELLALTSALALALALPSMRLRSPFSAAFCALLWSVSCFLASLATASFLLHLPFVNAL